MHILQATSFDQEIPVGGTTRPWIVLLEQDNGIEAPYVVKLFNKKDNEEQYPVFKEAACSLLAKEFCLETPSFAFAHFSEDFINLVLEKEQRDILKKKSNGLKFASRLIDSAVIYSSTVHASYLKEYDFANLYAFDRLVFNIDRGRRAEKPNVFFKDNSFLAFDHELTFPFIMPSTTDEMYIDTVRRGLEDVHYYPYQQHLCYTYLKSLSTVSKVGLFDEFHDHLMNLNVKGFEDNMVLLKQIGICCDQDYMLLDYLYRFKKQAHAFCKILQQSIL